MDSIITQVNREDEQQLNAFTNDKGRDCKANYFVNFTRFLNIFKAYFKGVVTMSQNTILYRLCYKNFMCVCLFR